LWQLFTNLACAQFVKCSRCSHNDCNASEQTRRSFLNMGSSTMKIRFLGNYSELKRCVLCTRLDGKWRLENNHKQFRTHDNGILNWWQSTGTLQFQGGQLAALRLEQAFTKIASAKALLHSEDTKVLTDSTEEIDKLKELVAKARIQRKKLKTLIKRARKIARGAKM
jgi:hypothetical protein